ncbi:hypothetical protein TNIN_447091 [Trichonephila inaurata madagascariensis]|uniref:Uncharacterized protein n=1 Tax=Trichonephila inaurata madagascariensis TaxID=2747483 RepID=A0A8X6YMC8_9ARAC|nr:hypothetical protein TNIN_447091 [Trichonephila inaurata madagascariensis]
MKGPPPQRVFIARWEGGGSKKLQSIVGGIPLTFSGVCRKTERAGATGLLTDRCGSTCGNRGRQSADPLTLELNSKRVAPQSSFSWHLPKTPVGMRWNVSRVTVEACSDGGHRTLGRGIGYKCMK